VPENSEFINSQAGALPFTHNFLLRDILTTGSQAPAWESFIQDKT
jgi:hypothetical protein